MLIPSPARAALGCLNEAGFEAYLVGGCVRDTVLGIPPHDYDICTAATPDEMKQVFRSFRLVETGIKHGTLTVLIENTPLEITTFRQDGEYLDHRRPREVLFTRTLESDLSRRDFTINAMAYHPGIGLVDLFGGQADCRQGIIRCVGDADTRFTEDALRILRALRFAARFRFRMDADTEKALLARQQLLKSISIERIAAETGGLMLADGAGQILQQYGEVLFTAVPGLAMPTADWQQACTALAHAEKAPLLRFAVLLSPLGAEKAAAILRLLKLPNQLQNDVAVLLRHQADALTEAGMLRTLMQVGDRLVPPLISLQQVLKTARTPGMQALHAQEAARLHHSARQLIDSNACYLLARLAVKGSDLLSLGITGPRVGQTLQQLLEAVVAGKVENEKEALLQLLQE